MAEYVVDCEELPSPTDPERMLVLPISVAGHVHERLVRCRECRYGNRYSLLGNDWLICEFRTTLQHVTDDDAFCSDGELRDGG